MNRRHSSRWSDCLLYAYIFAGCSILVSACSACHKQSPEVCLIKKDSTRECVSVETARTQSQRQLGLMYRNDLPVRSGMLFFFDAETKQAFTMRNTYIALDMIFISRDKRIVGIVENAAPLTEGPYMVDAASQYVLEVNGSFCREQGISVGDTVQFQGLR